MQKIPAQCPSYDVQARGYIELNMSRAGKTVVACYTTDGKLVKTYENAKQAARSRHLFPRTIDRCIRGDIKLVKNLQWKRFNIGEVPDEIQPLEIDTTSLSIKPVAKLGENNEILEVYPSIRNAAKNNNIDTHTLRDRLNKKYACLGKTKFRYLEDNELSKYGFEKGKKYDFKTKPVIQYDVDGKYIKSHPSIRAALLSLNKSPRNRGISECLSGKYETAFGYIWKYKNQENFNRPKRKKIYICCYSGNTLIKKYNSVKEAASTLGISVSAINNAIRLNRKAKGYYWKRV